MSNKNEVAQLSLIDGLSLVGTINPQDGQRIRLTFNPKTMKRLNELTKKDKERMKKQGHKGNWYPKDTLEQMINDRYEQLERWSR